MGRRANFQFTFPDRTIPYGLIKRNGIYRVRFWGPGPDSKEKHYDLSTGCRTLNDAHTEAAKMAAKIFNPTPLSNLTIATWDQVFSELESTAGLRETSLDVYRSIVRVLQSSVNTHGPGDVTLETAKRFIKLYSGGKYCRSNKPDAVEYKRSTKTIENATRRLSGLWSAYLIDLGYASSNPWAKITRPTLPKQAVRIPSEESVSKFFQWLRDRYPTWELIHAFVEVKSLAGCRTFDLCQVRSVQVKKGKLVISPDQDKTHRERVIPIPDDLFKRLDAMKGSSYLWERYALDAKKFRPGSRNCDAFSPRTLFWCVNNLFREFSKQHPEHKLRPHDLRKRCITLTVAASQSVDATAQAFGIDPSTARRYYLDASQAFDGAELLKRMASVLRPAAAS